MFQGRFPISALVAVSYGYLSVSHVATKDWREKLDKRARALYCVALMYLDSSSVTIKGKTYTRHLLRTSYRQNGKVKHHTVANLSKCSEAEIAAMRLALKHKGDLAELRGLSGSLELEQGFSVGAVFTVLSVAKDLGIVQSLGASREGKLAMWQVIARVIDQGSRLSAVRLATEHAACEALQLGSFDEDDLYSNLDWLCGKQKLIEDRLFRKQHAESPVLYLYDVTSSYLEGTQNALAAFGYNRDRKSGKMQIVIGLLCDDKGAPVSIQVYPGNTSDVKTLSGQIEKVASRFDAKEVAFVGDRGMIRGPQREALQEQGFRYITGLTKPELKRLVIDGVFQLSLFETELAEVVTEQERYILRRNLSRAAEIACSRESKLACLRERVAQYNSYLEEHPRARPDVGKRKMSRLAEKLRLGSWVRIETQERRLEVAVDEEALCEASRLDGCYALRTDLTQEDGDKDIIHARYKDLGLVERAFRTMKTGNLHVRPVHVRLETRTRAHCLVVMLAYAIVRELECRWAELDLTVQEGLDHLSRVCAQDVFIDGKRQYQLIPKVQGKLRDLLAEAKVTLPQVLPTRHATVATRKKLTERRVSH